MARPHGPELKELGTWIEDTPSPSPSLSLCVAAGRPATGVFFWKGPLFTQVGSQSVTQSMSQGDPAAQPAVVQKLFYLGPHCFKGGQTSAFSVAGFPLCFLFAMDRMVIKREGRPGLEA